MSRTVGERATVPQRPVGYRAVQPVYSAGQLFHKGWWVAVEHARYPVLLGRGECTPLAFMEYWPSPPQHCASRVQHGVPPALMQHPPSYPDSTELHGTSRGFMGPQPPPPPQHTGSKYYTVPHQPSWNTLTLPHSTGHWVYYCKVPTSFCGKIPCPLRHSIGHQLHGTPLG